jgi:hypothetical protein
MQWLVAKSSAELMRTLVDELDWTFSEVKLDILHTHLILFVSLSLGVLVQEARLWIYGPSGPESMSRNRKKV